MAEIEAARTLLSDLNEFTSEKWKHSECELCGTDRWMFYPEPTEYVYLIVANKSGPANTLPQPSVAFLPLSFVNCGNLRLIDARVFEKWREARDRITAKSST
jgi:hypothetical protein